LSNTAKVMERIVMSDRLLFLQMLRYARVRYIGVEVLGCWSVEVVLSGHSTLPRNSHGCFTCLILVFNLQLFNLQLFHSSTLQSSIFNSSTLQFFLPHRILFMFCREKKSSFIPMSNLRLWYSITVFCRGFSAGTISNRVGNTLPPMFLISLSVRVFTRTPSSS